MKPIDMNHNSKLRILIDPALPGAVNMAIDETILQAVNSGESPATLRFYQWDQPTISLGYFQPFDEFTSQDQVVRQMPVVRRQTGGGAILHHDELTYSLILPLTENNPHCRIEAMYLLIHDAFIAVLARYGVQAWYRGGLNRGNSQRGPFFCFARQHRLDLVIGPDKLLGSAQRRIKHAALQHGSLILGRHFQQQPSAQLKPNPTDKFELQPLIADLTSRIALTLRLTPAPGQLQPVETQRLDQFQAKYTGPDWNHLR